MKSVKRIAILLMCISVVACCNDKYLTKIDNFDIPQKTMQSCQKIEHLESGKDTDVIDFNRKLIKQYNECSQLNSDKANVIDGMVKTITTTSK